ncbi:hypothetical protein SLEP1_g12849 [Rubroshorea leprosula]|uniref:Uncharacterized protein n=1 Tax=Rubroshorea leprosula TaxID=152421 RepID=A0AAV5IN12_9ROSI|nr:hypothetical protein SLEP1_g12849 [Rubroshorea leprosula]
MFGDGLEFLSALLLSTMISTGSWEQIYITQDGYGCVVQCIQGESG